MTELEADDLDLVVDGRRECSAGILLKVVLLHELLQGLLLLLNLLVRLDCIMEFIHCLQVIGELLLFLLLTVMIELC